MRWRGIIMSSASVCPVLNGRKTQTRLLAKPEEFGASTWDQLPDDLAACWARDARPRHPRYGEAGDRLWVKESWRSWIRTCEDDGGHDDNAACAPHCNQTYVAYRATPRIGYRPVPDKARIRYLDESSSSETSTAATSSF